jgi:hypothetical protein
MARRMAGDIDVLRPDARQSGNRVILGEKGESPVLASPGDPRAQTAPRCSSNASCCV